MRKIRTAITTSTITAGIILVGAQAALAGTKWW